MPPEDTTWSKLLLEMISPLTWTPAETISNSSFAPLASVKAVTVPPAITIWPPESTLVPLAVPPEKTISVPPLATVTALVEPPDETTSSAPLEIVALSALPPDMTVCRMPLEKAKPLSLSVIPEDT